MHDYHVTPASDPALGSLYSFKGIEVMDTIRFKDNVVGSAPLTQEVIEVREGTEGTVTKISQEGHFTIEVPSLDSMLPQCFVEVDYELITLI